MLDILAIIGATLMVGVLIGILIDEVLGS